MIAHKIIIFAAKAVIFNMFMNIRANTQDKDLSSNMALDILPTFLKILRYKSKWKNKHK